MLIKSLKTQIIISFLLISNIAKAEHVMIFSASDYPYKNLIKRTDEVKIFYINNDEGLSCRAEIKRNNQKWTTALQHPNKEAFDHDPLAHCLSSDTAEQILTQTFIQFGRGL